MGIKGNFSWWMEKRNGEKIRTCLIISLGPEYVINVTELMGYVIFMVRVPRYGSFAIKVSRNDQKSKNHFEDLEVLSYS